jgi:hypothetical protein
MPKEESTPSPLAGEDWGEGANLPLVPSHEGKGKERQTLKGRQAAGLFI